MIIRTRYWSAIPLLDFSYIDESFCIMGTHGEKGAQLTSAKVGTKKRSGVSSELSAYSLKWKKIFARRRHRKKTRKAIMNRTLREAATVLTSCTTSVRLVSTSNQDQKCARLNLSAFFSVQSDTWKEYTTTSPFAETPIENWGAKTSWPRNLMEFDFFRQSSRVIEETSSGSLVSRYNSVPNHISPWLIDTNFYRVTL